MSDGYLALVSPIADGGVAHFLDTAGAYASGKLESWRANGVEKAYVDFEGSFQGHDGIFGGKVTVGETAVITGNVAIGGTHTAAELLHIKEGSGTTPTTDGTCVAVFQRNISTAHGVAIDLVSGTAGSCSINFGDADDDNQGGVSYDNNVSLMGFRVANSQYMTLNNTVLAVTPNLSIGATPATTGTFRLPDNFTMFKADSSHGNIVVMAENAIMGTGILDIGDNGTGKWTAIHFHPGAISVLSMTSTLVSVTKPFTSNDKYILTNAAEGNTGNIMLLSTRQVVSMGSGSTAVSTSITVPSGGRLIGVALNVDVAVTNAGDNTWGAAFSGGSTTTIAATGTAAAQNTKISLMLDDEVTSGVTEVTFTPQTANFTGGSIEVVVWYQKITALANA